MSREDYIILALLTVLFMLLLFYVNSEYVYASETPNEVEQTEEQTEVHTIIERLDEMQIKRAEHEAETKTFMANVQTKLETANTFLSEVSNLMIWLVALTAFQAALTVTLVFAVSWGKK